MTSTLLVRIPAGVFVACMFASAPAVATPIVWQIEGVSDATGALPELPLVGSFTFDATSGAYSDVSLTFDGVQYESVISGDATRLLVVASLPAVLFTPDINLVFDTPLTDAGGTVPLFSGSVGQCGNTGCTLLLVPVLRTIDSGTATAVPEPTALALLGSGLLGLAWRRRTSTPAPIRP